MKTCLLALGFLVFVSQATPPRDTPVPRTTGTSTVRGKVTAAATGQPLNRVRITLNGQGGNPPTGVTDARGEFEITEVPAGSYSVSATRAGYLPLQYGQRRPHEAGRTIEILDKEVVEQIDFMLPRASVLSGRITDDVGDAFPGVRIEALEFRYLKGRRMLLQAASANTDDRGQYRLSGLPPGIYHLRASSPETWESDDGAVTFAYATTYYPGVAATDLAESVTVAVGQEIGTLDFALRPGRSARITGTIHSAAGDPIGAQQISMDRALRGVGGARLSLGLGGSTRSDANGSFEFRNLAPGEYMIYSGADTDRATVTVVVGDGEVRHVTLTPRKATSVRGSIVTDEGTPVPFPTGLLRVEPVNADPENLFPSFSQPALASIDREAAFRLTNLDGPYLFRLTGLPKEWMLAAVRLGGRDFTDTPLTFSAGVADTTGLQIVISRKAGKVDGQVMQADGTAAADSTIVVFAADPARWTLASRFVKIARPDRTGRFSITGLPAGAYAAIARDFVANGEWEDQAFLTAARRQAVQFELAERGSQTLTLKVEPRQ